MQRETTRQLLIVVLVIGGCGNTATALDQLAYKLHPGQAFAYDVSIAWTQSGLPQRLTGQPFYQVHHRDGERAIMMVIGKLRYEAMENGEWKRDSSHDYWCGTTLTIDKRADRVDGMMGEGGEICPRSVASSMCRLIFPELPRHDEDHLRSGETSKIIEMRFGGWEKATNLTRKGQRQGRTQARPLIGSLVQLDTVNQYVTQDKTLQSLYRAQATFDKRIGALLENKVVATRTDRGESYSVSMNIRRIQDEPALTAAKEQANRDYAQLPSGMLPVKLTRKRLNLRLPERYTMDKLPNKGTVVGYFNSKDKEWYTVQFIKAVGPYRVQIRYLGSGETIDIHVAQMAYTNRSRVK